MGARFFTAGQWVSGSLFAISKISGCPVLYFSPVLYRFISGSLVLY
jgi:hypothetical protein